MPTSAPYRRSIAALKLRYLEHKLKHRPAAQYFTIPPRLLEEYNQARALVASTIKESPTHHA